MATKALKFCKHPGCCNLTDNGYCDEHQDDIKIKNKQYDKSRGTAQERGYTYAWQQYSKAFLKRPENIICKLHLKGCTNLSQCVDHIKPPANREEFWDTNNHQGACIHCNSVKGHTYLKGEYDMVQYIKEKQNGK